MKVRNMNWLEEPTAPQTIAGERRVDRRYEIQLELRWKLIRRRKVVETGTGRTMDFSSGGVLFDAMRELVPGLNVELHISWPVLLHNVAPMQLVVAGKIVRIRGTHAAVRMVQHEFRTTGAQPERRMTVGTGAVMWPGPVKGQNRIQ
jgi:hypothetical protein